MPKPLAIGDANTFLINLLEISRDTLSSEGVHEPARKLLGLSLAATGMGSGAVYLHDHSADGLRLIAWQNADESAPTLWSPLVDASTAQVSVTGVPLFRVDGQEGSTPSVEPGKPLSLVVLPLVARGLTVGALSLAANPPVYLDRSTLGLLELTADQLAVAIENSRLYGDALDQRAKARGVIDGCADGIMVVDHQHGILDVNPALERLAGLPAQNLLGRNCTHLLGACNEAGESVCDVFCPMRAQGSVPDGEVEACIRRPSGETIWVGITYGLLRDSSGNASGVVHTIRDISSQKSAQVAVAESGRRAEVERQRLQAVIDALPEGVCIASPGGQQSLLANRKAVELLGSPWCMVRTCGDEDGGFGLRSVDGQPFTGDRLPLVRSLNGEVCSGVQLDVTRPGGRNATLLVNSAPFFDGSAITGAVAVFQDITTIKEVERMKDSFIAAAAHELRTPVTSIRGYAQLLQRRLDSGEGRVDALKASRIIIRQVDRLLWLMNQLLDASRASKGELSLAPSKCDLSALAAEVVERKRLLVDRHSFALYAPESVHAWIDGPRVEQVLVNLLNNAIEYSPSGGHIDVHVHRRGKEAIVTVADEGLGIAADKLNGIFKRFYCAHDDLMRSNGGLGLGLYLSHEIVTRHGGSMWVESKEGVGSKFHFSLPAADDHEQGAVEERI